MPERILLVCDASPYCGVFAYATATMKQLGYTNLLAQQAFFMNGRAHEPVLFSPQRYALNGHILQTTEFIAFECPRLMSLWTSLVNCRNDSYWPE